MARSLFGRRAYVIGQPIGHSLSPILHQHWLDQQNIQDGSYTALEVSPRELATTLDDFWADKRVMGCNVTIPHKQEIVKLCAALTPRARRMNAVNTVIRTQEGWLGDSSDGWAFVRSLQLQLGITNKKDKTFDHVMIIGAGGAAISIADALLEEQIVGKRLVILNRSREKAEKMCQRLQQQWSETRDIVIESVVYPQKIDNSDIDLLIHTTSMGMLGGPPFGLPLTHLKKECVVADIVYRPLITPCLENAQELGNPVVDGLGMLLYQGVIGFQAWFGIEPKVDDRVRQILIQSMEKKHKEQLGKS